MAENHKINKYQYLIFKFQTLNNDSFSLNIVFLNLKFTCPVKEIENLMRSIISRGKLFVPIAIGIDYCAKGMPSAQFPVYLG